MKILAILLFLAPVPFATAALSDGMDPLFTVLTYPTEIPPEGGKGKDGN